MTYLYGDATESPLDRNYVEFLRALLEFGASMLQSHASIARQELQLKGRESTAVATLEQLRAVSGLLTSMLDETTTRFNASITKQCIEGIRQAGLGEVRRSETGLQKAFARDRNEVGGSIKVDRAKNLARLERLLLKHDLPKSAQRVTIALDPKGVYRATLTGKSACQMEWEIELDIPKDHVLSELLRLDRVAPQLAVKFPAESGWVRKSVKLRAYKLSSKYVTRIVFTDASAAMVLRNSKDGNEGFDIMRDVKTGIFFLRRVVKGKESEPYEVQGDDAKALAPVWDELIGAAVKLTHHRRALTEATYDGTPLQELTNAPVLVKELVAEVAPVVKAIAKHSQSPDELVLKRVLAGHRREEIFVSKAELAAIIAPLPAKLRKIFDPLGLQGAAPPAQAASAAPPAQATSAAPPAQAAPSVETEDPAIQDEPTRLRSSEKVTSPSLGRMLPKPSVPPPKRKSRRQVGNQVRVAPPKGPVRGKAKAKSPAADPGADPQPSDAAAEPPGDSVEVPLDDLDNK